MPCSEFDLFLVIIPTFLLPSSIVYVWARRKGLIRIGNEVDRTWINLEVQFRERHNQIS